MRSSFWVLQITLMCDTVLTAALSGSSLPAQAPSDAATVENLIWETQTVLRVSVAAMMDEQRLFQMQRTLTFRPEHFC